MERGTATRGGRLAVPYFGLRGLKMSADLRKILDDRIDHLDRHGHFEQADIAKRAKEQLFPRRDRRPDERREETPRDAVTV